MEDVCIVCLVPFLKGPEAWFSAAQWETTVIGRVNDLQKLKLWERSLLSSLPFKEIAKLNWKQNSRRLRETMAKGRPIRDASPGDKRGQFLNAERNLLENRGWTLDKGSNYWNPPNL